MLFQVIARMHVFLVAAHDPTLALQNAMAFVAHEANDQTRLQTCFPAQLADVQSIVLTVPSKLLAACIGLRRHDPFFDHAILILVSFVGKVLVDELIDCCQFFVEGWFIQQSAFLAGALGFARLYSSASMMRILQPMVVITSLPVLNGVCCSTGADAQPTRNRERIRAVFMSVIVSVWRVIKKLLNS